MALLSQYSYNSLPVGSILQTLISTTNATTTITKEFPLTTKPQYDANCIILTRTITPFSTSNKVLIQALISGNSSLSTASIILALFNTTSGDAIAAMPYVDPNAYGSSYYFTFLHSPNTTDEITYRLGVGMQGANSFYLNKRSLITDFTLGGLHISSLIVQEIKG